MLEGKVAVVYGGSGGVGAAIGRAFARNGAQVHLVARTASKLEEAARSIEAETAAAVHVAALDATDPSAVGAHLDALVDESGGVDVVFNAVGGANVFGVPLVDLSADEAIADLGARFRGQLVPAQEAGRRMAARGSGVVLFLTATVSRIAMSNVGIFGAACAATEALCHGLGAELASRGVRTVVLRSGGSPDAPGMREATTQVALSTGRTFEEMLADMERPLPTGHLPRLAEVADAAVVLASDAGRAVTATAVNVSGGQLVD
jgi:NAD(P)-dependent dehydrogenase (short-subunit alcohol dehydrogenase family)